MTKFYYKILWLIFKTRTFKICFFQDRQPGRSSLHQGVSTLQRDHRRPGNRNAGHDQHRRTSKDSTHGSRIGRNRRSGVAETSDEGHGSVAVFQRQLWHRRHRTRQRRRRCLRWIWRIRRNWNVKIKIKLNLLIRKFCTTENCIDSSPNLKAPVKFKLFLLP